ncbi:MAG: hypothetical protein JWP91_4711 [Fibrobacteres bacterium]|nr:hypothetical protein [Fibrobacterota bacterium]
MLSGPVPNVFDYLNYQAFLKDLYEVRKARSPYFSYRYLGKRLSVDPGYLVKIIQGKLQIPVKSIDRINQYCGFHGREAEYLREMVIYGRAKRIKDIKVHFENMIRLRDKELRKVEISQYSFFRKWYHSAIHCLLMFHEFDGDFKSLAAKLSPRISAEEAEESIRLLIELKFLRKTQAGKYLVTDNRLSTGEKWQSAAIRNYQEECLKLAGESLNRHEKDIRDISTVTIPMSDKDFEEVKDRIKELRQSLLHLDPENGKPMSVYQVNIQLFPLTQIGVA